MVAPKAPGVQPYGPQGIRQGKGVRVDKAYCSGDFGEWVEDAEGNPAYDCDPAKAHIDQWHLIGNDRISATMHTGGYLQVYDWSRGGKILNRWDPGSGRRAGGFVRISVNGIDWSTLRRDLPEGSVQRIRWGMGYGEKRTELGDLVVIERYEPAPGDGSWIEGAVTVENRGTTPLAVSVFAVWTIAMHQLTAAPIMTHGLDRWYDRWRARLNRRFRLSIREENGGIVARYEPRKKAPPPDKPTWTDWHPPAIRMEAEGDGVTHSLYGEVSQSYIGSWPIPSFEPKVEPCRDDEIGGMPGTEYTTHAFSIRNSAAPGEHLQLLTRIGIGTAFETVKKQKCSREIQINSANYPFLVREMQWHASYLQAGTHWSNYFESHFIDQGSAYSYLQGASGAPRDFALFILPMIYLRPEIARDALRHLFRSQSAKGGKFPYAHTGHGIVSGAVVHSYSSDLDLFVLWALAEYIGATGDTAFLEEPLPYYPLSSGKMGTVLEHARASFAHLRDSVGLGRHGLIRSGTGDWNDVLLAFSRLPPLTIWRGESALNAGLATVALPALADALGEAHPGFSAELRAFADSQAKALKPLWLGKWMARGYLGYGEAMLGHDRLFLDAQAFPVLSGVWDAARARTLFDTIQEICVDPQPAGALCLYPPMKGPLLDPGSDTNGGTWAAIDAWTAWAWSRVDPEAAWAFFLRTTMAARAEAYPQTWYGIWSGPDAFNAHYHPRAAETFNLNATPMARYPVMNMNRHAGPLLDIIKFAGMGPKGGRFVFDPVIPEERYTVHFPLAGVSREPGMLSGYFVPQRDGRYRFAVRGMEGGVLDVNGTAREIVPDEDGLWHFESDGSALERISWCVTASVG
mgnify:CR=1 FL=1